MSTSHAFIKTVLSIAVPVALQCMLQSSFSIIDQIMIGQLGSVSIAAVGLAGKFSSIYQVVVSAIAVVAGIMIAQYMGKGEQAQVDRSLSVNLAAAILLALRELKQGTPFQQPGMLPVQLVLRDSTAPCKISK